MGVGCGTYLLAREKILAEQRALFPASGGAYSSGMPKKPPPTISRTKNPMPMIQPIPVIAPAPGRGHPSVTTWRDGQNPTGKLTRPNPVVRRGRK